MLVIECVFFGREIEPLRKVIGNVGIEKHRDDELGTDPYLSRIAPFADSRAHAAWNPEEASILT